jgi:hypothetical protein
VINIEPTLETSEEPPAKRSRPSPARETNVTTTRRSRQHAARKSPDIQIEPELERSDQTPSHITTDSVSEQVSEDDINVIIGEEGSEVGKVREGYGSLCQSGKNIDIDFLQLSTPL